MSFVELLENHKQSTSSQTINKEALKQRVFQLLSQNVSTQKLFDEEIARAQDSYICDGSISGSSKSLGIEALVRCLEDESICVGVSMGITTAGRLANQLKRLLSTDSKRLLLTDEQKKQFDVILAAASLLQTKGNFNRNIFTKVINQEMALPVEVVWQLHVSSIMPLDAFITHNLSKPQVIGDLSSNVVSLCLINDDNSKQKRKYIVQGIMCYLISQAYGERVKDTEDASLKGLKKVAAALLDNITKKLMTSEDSQRSFDICPYEIIISEHPSVDVTTAKRYITKQFCVILGINPVIKVSEAIQQQEQWSLFKADKFTITSFPQLLSVFDVDEALSLLKHVIESQEVNWKRLLVYTSSVLICYKGAPPAMSKLISDLLRNALETNQQDGLIAGFLLARQSCSEGPHVFASYQQWFGTTFSDTATNLVTNKKAFMFLMKFLTDIVPFELPKYLKAHLLRPPSGPPKCRPLLTDYITLVKTRLMDLKEPMEELGIYADGSKAKTEKIQLQTQQEINKALENFDKTGRVPANIMEASIFRKPYFIGHFLPALLTPRPLPDKPDIKMKFIESLRKAEKIPATMYAKYESACDKLTSQLLQGVFDDDEDDMEELLLSPWQQLQNSIAAFKEAVLSTKEQQKDISGFASCISAMSEKISCYLQSVSVSHIPANDAKQCPVDLDHFIINKEVMQIIKEVQDMLCDVDDKLGGGVQYPEWRLQLLCMLTSHSTLWAAYCVQLLRSVYKQWYGLKMSHIKSVAITLLHILTYPELLPMASITYNDLPVDWQQILSSVLEPTCKHRMFFILKLCFCYLHNALMQFSDVGLHYAERKEAFIPHEIVCMFTYLSQRLITPLAQPTGITPIYLSEMDQEWPGVVQDITSLYKTEQLQTLIGAHKLSLRDWVKLELCISQGCDYLKPEARQSYLDYTIYHHYLPKPAAEGGCDGDIFVCLSMICIILLDIEPHSPGAQWRGNYCMCAPSQNITTHSRSDILLLAQRLVSVLTVQNVSMATSPWMPHFLMQKTCSGSRDISDCSAGVIKGFSLMLSLPPYLLLCNSLKHLPKQSPEGATELITLINDYWRHHITNGVVLSLECTSYLIQGLLCLCPENPTLASHILKKCPCIVVAVLFHWQSLSYIRSLVGDDVPKAFHLISMYPDLLHRNVDRLRMKQLHINDLSPLPTDGIWHLGVVISSLLFTRLEVVDQVSSLLHEWVESDQFKQANQHVLLTAIHCLLAGMSWQFLYHEDVNSSWCELIHNLWRKQSELFVSCIQNVLSPGGSQNICSLLPDLSQKLLPAMLCRVLVAHSLDNIFTAVHTPGLVESVLSLHVRCMELYDRSIPGQDIKVDGDSSQPLSISHLSHLSSWIQLLLSRCTQNELRNVSQEIVHGCDPDIRRAFSLAMKR